MSTPEPGAGARAKAIVRKAGGPIVAKLRDQTAEALRPELDAAQAEVARLRDELTTTTAELRAEIELLWAELAARRGDQA